MCKVMIFHMIMVILIAYTNQRLFFFFLVIRFNKPINRLRVQLRWRVTSFWLDSFGITLSSVNPAAVKNTAKQIKITFQSSLP